MPNFKISVDAEALQDIQDATDWYNEQLPGLGSRFQKQVKNQINSLKKNARGYAIRYGDVRFVLIKKFPFLVHFVLDESRKTVDIIAVLHTSRNPRIWSGRIVEQ